MIKVKSIIKLQSSLLYILSGLLLIPLIAVFIYDERSVQYSYFIIPAIFSAVLGVIFQLMTRNHKIELDLATSMYLCTYSWLLLSLISAIPLVLSLEISFTDGFFEAVSGLTTTGITVLQGLDSMPYSVLLWRSIIQFVGGLGILTFFLFITTSSDGEIWQLFSAEGHKINSARPVPNVFKTITYFWLIYGAYTMAEIMILRILGLTFFDAITHSLTSLSTGGFSTHDASVGYYASAGYKHYRLIEYTVILFMFLGGINFLVHYKMLKEDRLIMFKDIETKVYLKIIGGFTGLTVIGIYVLRGLDLGELEETIRKTLFQIVSLITSTGFGTEDISSHFFPTITKQLFVILMIVGGCVGSTSGGIKVLRVVILNKLLRREIKKVHMPSSAVLPVTVDKNIIDHQEVLRIAALVFGWIVFIIVGAGITALFSDLGPFEAFSGMASAVGNMGPFYFSVGTMASLSPIIKYTYIVGMLAGRLELIPIYIVLFRSRK